MGNLYSELLMAFVMTFSLNSAEFKVDQKNFFLALNNNVRVIQEVYENPYFESNNSDLKLSYNILTFNGTVFNGSLLGQKIDQRNTHSSNSVVFLKWDINGMVAKKELNINWLETNGNNGVIRKAEFLGNNKIFGLFLKSSVIPENDSHGTCEQTLSYFYYDYEKSIFVSKILAKGYCGGKDLNVPGEILSSLESVDYSQIEITQEFTITTRKNVYTFQVEVQ